MNTLTVITTPPCRYCDRTTAIVADAAGPDALAAGMSPARAFPSLSVADAHLAATGTHAECEAGATRFALATYSPTDGDAYSLIDL